MQQCLGPQYTDNTHLAWRKLFSAMLVVLVPVAVACEQKNEHAAQIKRQEATNISSYSWRESQRMKNESDKRYKSSHGDGIDTATTDPPLYHAASDDVPIFRAEEA
jgi:hypothetical protein